MGSGLIQSVKLLPLTMSDYVEFKPTYSREYQMVFGDKVYCFKLVQLLMVIHVECLWAIIKHNKIEKNKELDC